MAAEHRKRTALLKEGFKKLKLDSFLVSDETNVSYLSGFTGHDAMALVSRGRAFLITDSMYSEEAAGTVDGFDIIVRGSSGYETISGIVSRHKLKRVGFESMDLPFGVANKLKRALRRSDMVPVCGAVERLRSVKDRSEIGLIRDSIALTKRVFENILSCVRPGASERSIAVRCEKAFIDGGARPAFDPIIAAGANSSKPHASPTDAAIKKDSHVMIDIGCNLRGYCSDLTRMVFTGRVKEKLKKMYHAVRSAQEDAIAKIAPGVKAREVDSAARLRITDCGLGKYFVHSLGHGVGMEIHEEPAISPTGDTVLRPGMVFTVEPAVYVPRFGGVRIEDMILVTDDGCEILTR
jgi:Xaa-Pro aminopeptidase